MEFIVSLQELNMDRYCKNCAYLRKTCFKKRSKHYGRIIYWCKKVDLSKGGPYVNPAKDITTQVCKNHETKEERRLANDRIKEKILKDTETKRIKSKEW